ncbi:dynamin family protein [Sphaerospermopsis torques-reginae]|uniref:Dynamin family protein n=1 Tax=Sphaerospermopsis torques-reginae ITEP-024 TaxID=984208 RepID=A0ABX8WUB1_9CYAN|nr:dynamin family protein [Sphaerospermopsis torques-reginae]QYX30004.1 dynamin family protein [Sphaerospermopsis torques-reginae ITEP-024]
MIEKLLATSIENLEQFGTAIEDLINKHSDVFKQDLTEIHKNYRDFREAYEEALERLKNPRLSITMIGTTSSGKSTLLNGLIAHQISPIESQEKSAGILKVEHSETRKLVIKGRDGKVKEEHENLNNKEIYDKISTIMDNYNSRKVRDLPNLTVFLPILPVCDSSLLGLPPSMRVEFIDLPGINTVLDRNNLNTIQKNIKKSFSIVVINYNYVNKDDTKALFKEIEETIKSFKIDTRLMIFILNKCDLHNKYDLPLPERINVIQKSIQEQLKLSTAPEILPFSSQSLQYAQCAWGPASLKDKSPVDQSTRFIQVEGMMNDCFGYFENKIGQIEDENTYNKLKETFRSLKDNIDRAKRHNKDIIISDELMSEILKYVQEWTGAKELWNCLRTRFEDFLEEVILIPTLTPVIINYNALEESIKSLEDTTKNKTQKEIEKKRKENLSNQEKLSRKINDITQETRSRIRNIQQTLQTNNTSDERRNSLALDLNNKGMSGFLNLFNIVDNIKQDLLISLVIPVRDALRNNLPADDLEKDLKKCISPDNLKRVIESYKLVVTKITQLNLDSSREYLTMKVRANDNTQIKKYEDIERSVRKLYIVMRNSIQARCSFLLQTEVQELEEAVNSLVNDQNKEIYGFCISSEKSENLNFYNTITTYFEKKQIGTPIQPPEELFEMNISIDEKTIKEEEVVGQTKKTTQKGSCFKKTDTEIVDQRGDVEYTVFSIPNPDTMGKQWSQGIDKAEPMLWNIIFNWLTQCLDNSVENFSNSATDVLNYTNKLLDDQMQILEQNLLDLHKKQWEEIRTQQTLAKTILEKLQYTKNR